MNDRYTSGTPDLPANTFLRLTRSFSSTTIPLPLIQPSIVLSVPFFLLPVPSVLSPLIRTSTTTSSSVPLPSPVLPNMRSSTSYVRPAIGTNTLQNFSGDERGGGGVDREVAIWVKSAGGCAVMSESEGENEGVMSKGRKAEEEGVMAWIIKRESMWSMSNETRNNGSTYAHLGGIARHAEHRIEMHTQWLLRISSREVCPMSQ
jgi:hypothetical protein